MNCAYRSELRRRAIWSLLIFFVCVASMGSAASVLDILGLDGRGWWQVFFFGLSGSLAFWIWWVLPWTDRVSRFASVGACILIAWLLNRVVWTMDFLIAGERFSEWVVYSEDGPWSVLQAELMSVLGVLLVLLIWFFFGGISPPFANAVDALSQPGMRRLFRLVYAISVFSVLMDEFLTTPAPVRELVNWWRFGGLGALLLLALTSHRGFRLVLAGLVVASIPFLFASLDDAMKESIIQALLPIIAFLVIRVRRLSAQVSLGVALIVLLSFVSALNSFTRFNLRASGNEFSYSFIREFFSTARGVGTEEVAVLGADDLLRRANSGNYRGYAIAIAHNEGFKAELVFGPAIYSLIPRAIWTDKPPNLQGEDYNALLFGRYGSSMSTGLFAGAYLGAGWLGVLSVGLTLGLFLVLCSWGSIRYGGVSFHYLYTFAFVPHALRIDEGWVGSSLTGWVAGFLYLVLLHAIASGLLALWRPSGAGRGAEGRS